MNRPQWWGRWPGEQRPEVVLTREELCAMPLCHIGRGSRGPPLAMAPAASMNDAPGGSTFLVLEFHDWPGRFVMLQATVIAGPWRYGERGAGDRVPCAADDPRRWRPDPGAPDWRNQPHGGLTRTVGYAVVHTECPALDAMLARRRAA